MTIKEIKNKWNKDKDYYRTQELGTGVYSFKRFFNNDICKQKQGF